MRRFGLKIFMIVGIFACFAALSAVAHAQDFPPARGRIPGMAGIPGGVPGLQGFLPLLTLNLSQDQQKSMLDIFEKYRENRTAYLDTMMALDQEMLDIVEADILDEENARAVIKKQAAVQEEVTILEIKMNHEIEAVLSSEQLELLRQPGTGGPGRPFPPQRE